jgi:acyl-coenzyme A synthetase/AMP-(fatty) acid ligase
MNNWFDHIMFHTRARPETPAIVMEDRVVTYGMLAAGIERCAHRIVALNIAGDGTVAVLIKNPIQHFVVSFALYRVGIQAVSLEHGQSGIDKIKFSAALGDNDAASLIDPVIRYVEVTDAWFSQDLPAGGELPKSFSQAGQICRWSLTSGTTGIPKIVQHRVADVGRRIFKFIDLNWNFVLSLPGLSSNWGFTNGCAALATGRTLCLAESPFQAIRMIELFSIDLVVASTEQLVALTRAARKAGAHLRSLRAIQLSGSVPTRVLLESAMVYLCNDIHCRYSASEIGHVASVTAREVLSRPGLVGHVMPGMEVAIFDARGGRCPPGQAGIIRCRRIEDSVSGAGQPEQLWTDLGDVGWLAHDGQLFIVGRAADANAIGQHISSAHQISPVHEIEHLMRLEWDMTDAAAVLFEDKSSGLGAQICVGVVDNKGASADKLMAIARTHGIQHSIRLFELAAIPRGANGKVNREQLKALMLEPATKIGAA